jgi:hypothetical protein
VQPESPDSSTEEHTTGRGAGIERKRSSRNESSEGWLSEKKEDAKKKREHGQSQFTVQGSGREEKKRDLAG